LRRLLPVPWANRTTPRASSGRLRSPQSRLPRALTVTLAAFMRGLYPVGPAPTDGRSRRRSAARLGGLAVVVAAQRGDELALAHVRATLDAGAARVVVQLGLRLGRVDASRGRQRVVARLPAAARVLGVGGPGALLQLPVVAVLLGDAL